MSDSDPLLHTIQDNDGDTPLMQAVLSHQLEIVSWFASTDPDCMKTHKKNKQNVIHCAAENNNTEIASVLLKALKSSDKLSLISSSENNCVTAFYWSSSEGHLGFSKKLPEEYKSCMSESVPLYHTIQENNGDTPLMQAVLSHHLEIVSWLESIDPDGMKLRNRN